MEYILKCSQCGQLQFQSKDYDSLERLALSHQSQKGMEHDIKIWPMKSSGR